MAESARIMLTATWAQVAIGCIGLIGLLATLLITGFIAVRQLRAYVSVSVTHLNGLSEGKTPYVTFAMTNKGETPAYRLRYYGALVIMPYPLQPIKGPIIDFVPGPEQVEPDQVLHIGADAIGTVYARAPLTADELQRVRDGTESRLYFVLVVEYRDTFRLFRATRACLFIGGKEFSDAWDAARARGERRVATPWSVHYAHNDAT